MSKTRRNHSPAFKAKVAVEALQGHRTIHEIAAHHQVHPNQVTQWRRRLIEQAGTVFAGHQEGRDTAPDREALLAKIGQLTVERDFLSRAFGQ
jgi:transposase-like protein